MNYFSPVPAPLSAQEFYVLLTLNADESHGYDLVGRIYNVSLGSVKLAGGTLYPLLKRLCAMGWIEQLESKPAGKSGKLRVHYGISELGVIRLKEELIRLEHALKVADFYHLLVNDEPLELAKIRVQARSGR